LRGWSDNFGSGWSRERTVHHPDGEDGAVEMSGWRTRDLEWSKAEFSQRTLDDPPFPIMMAVVEAAVTANMCRA